MKKVSTLLFLLMLISVITRSQQSSALESNNLSISNIDEHSFDKVKKSGRIENYLDFIKNTTTGNWKSVAQDSILSIAQRTKDLTALRYCVDNFRNTKKMNALLAFHDVYTNDGERRTLDLFYNKYNNEVFRDIKSNDYKLAKLGDDLCLEYPYNSKNFAKYDAYIRIAAPREKAFVALQRMIALNISKKEWKPAIEKVEFYKPFFEKDNERVFNLIALLSDEQDRSIKIKSVGKFVNTTGSEYLPVLTPDEKELYYCGRNKPDNIGGEDIFVSEKVNGNWGKGQLVSNLSTPITNDAPLSISADGSTMLVFESGKLKYAKKSSDGWSSTNEFSALINSGSWQADAMLTSNGRGLIFSTIQAGSENRFDNRQHYHGDILYPSDIYISLLNEKDEWGEPINLGKTINTPFCDRMPFLHPDMKTLYFSSDGHGGFGKMDIFKSTRLTDSCWNCWSEPVNLGKTINTSESDADFKITSSGEKAYFSYEKITSSESSTLFLLDVSGSMNGVKLQELKNATLAASKKAIRNNTEVAILTFGGDCVYPLSNIFPFSTDIDSLELFTQKLKTMNGTPMYEAYLFACDYMKNNSSTKSKNKTITLMSDGNSTSCSKLNDVLQIIKEKGEIYKTQSIAYNVSNECIAYADLKQISAFSDGKFHSTCDFNELNVENKNSVNEIFNTNTVSFNKDIYWINLPQRFRPEKVITVRGRLIDQNNRPIEAKIRVEDLETGDIIGQSKSNPGDGSYLIILPTGKIYGYYVDEEEYFPVSNNVDLKATHEIIMVDNDLKAIKFTQLLDKGMVVPLNNIFFQFSKYSLLPYSIPELKRVASIIKKSGFHVEISGYTDSVGEDEPNQILSEKRAESVKEFFVLEGCEASNFVTRGYGEKKPITTNKTVSGRAKNRRVELKFVK